MGKKEDVAREIQQAAERSLEVRVGPLREAVEKIRAHLESLRDALGEVEKGIPEGSGFLPDGPLLTLLEKVETTAVAAAPAPATAAPVEAATASVWPRLKDAIIAIDTGKTQVEILNAFLDGAARFADRIGLFVLKGERAAGWKGAGFAKYGGTDDAVKTVAVSPADDVDVARLFQEEKSLFLDGSAGGFPSRLPGTAPERAVLIPMTIKEKVAAFVYADRMSDGGGEVDFHAIEVLTLITSRSIDLLQGRKKVPSPSLTPYAAPGAGVASAAADVDVAEDVGDDTTTRAMKMPRPAAPEAPPQPAAPEPAAPSAAPRPPAAKPPTAPPEPPPRLSIKIPTQQPATVEAEPAPPSKPVSAVSPAPVPPPAEPPKVAPAPSPSLEFEPLESPKPKAAPTPPPAAKPTTKTAAPPAMDFSFEPAPEPTAPAPPPPAPKPAPAAAEKPAAGGGLGALGEGGKSTQFIPPAHLQKKTPGVIGGGRSENPPGLSPEEAKKHDEARRFARLLVSEIKLYNEAAVNEGRRRGSIYDKLKDDIDRSRQMYDDRTPSEIQTKTNYFYDELVRILADGSPDLLGL